MKIEHEGNNLRVSEIVELNAINASSFRDEVRAAMPNSPERIEIDLSQTRFVDSSGLGALFALYKAANSSHDGVTLRLINPRPSIQQLFELTQLHQLFEISRSDPADALKLHAAAAKTA
jgi:anti-sigma B factor antagonist